MFTFDARHVLLSLKIGFSFVRAAVACAILERISGLEPSSEKENCSEVIEASNGIQLLSFYVISL